MQQFSTDGKPIEIELISGHLLFIDPLYLQDIIDSLDNFTKVPENKKEFVSYLEGTFFPDGGGGLLGYYHVKENARTFIFTPPLLKKWDWKNEFESRLAVTKEVTTFGIDSASFILLDIEIIAKIFGVFSYDELIDSIHNNSLNEYFEKVNRLIGSKGWGFVSNGTADASIDFDGDGSYILK